MYPAMLLAASALLEPHIRASDKVKKMMPYIFN
jgi:hypothetical protein